MDNRMMKWSPEEKVTILCSVYREEPLLKSPKRWLDHRKKDAAMSHQVYTVMNKIL